MNKNNRIKSFILLLLRGWLGATPCVSVSLNILDVVFKTLCLRPIGSILFFRFVGVVMDLSLSFDIVQD